MSTESESIRGHDRARPSEVVGGYLSALAIFASIVGIAWHPLRLIPISMVFGLVGASMAPHGNRLARTAVMITAVCFFLGLTVSVVTSRPLW